jgi:hypothetical protein
VPKHRITLLFLFAGALYGEVDFNREIRPVLSENCFQCHGPDDKHRMAGVRLDTQEGAFAQTKRGPLISPGDPDKSLILQRMTHPQAARRMPPPSVDRKVTDKQIETIRRWIAEGAKWQTHWSFNPPRRVDPPADTPNPIDAFVNARLEREGLKPNPEADRRTLLRRLSLDLTGFPPTLEEIEGFVKDKSPDAYGKQVDRLLASPHYGERMAMDWLDVARYADTHGYHIDSHREIWPWRDWLIKSFSSNMPFDRFTRLQLAGDLMPDAGLEGQIASGFNRNHMINFEGGAIPEEYLVEYVADRAETTSTAFMGLTMGCARCHTHKYDPISHKEYYQFFAFFNNIDEKGLDGKAGNAKPYLKLPTPEQAQDLAELEARVDLWDAALRSDDVMKPLAKWRDTLAGKPASFVREGLVAHYDFDGSLVDSSGGYQHGRMLKGDATFGSGQVSRSVSFDAQTLVTLGNRVGSLAREKPFTIAFWLRPTGSKQDMPVLQKIDNTQTRRGWEIWLTDYTLVGIQKRAGRINVRLTSQWPDNGIELRTKDRFVQSEWVHVALVYDGSSKAAGLRLYVNGAPAETEVVRDGLSGPIQNEAELRIGTKEPEAKAFAGGLDDLRFYTRALAADDLRHTAVDYPMQVMLSGVAGKPSKQEDERLRDYYLRFVAPPYFRTLHSELRDDREKLEQLNKRIVTTMVMSELTEKRRATHILGRGDYRNKLEEVSPGVPSVLPPLRVSEKPPAGMGIAAAHLITASNDDSVDSQEIAEPPLVGAGSERRPTRLDLANWLLDPRHPLTARVAVNRYWQLYFGTGLVKTAENFGSQGDPPSHPELLDWLATEFIRTGWDVKAMQRLIVTSAAYRRSSTSNPALQERDPENRLLARGPRFRLPAELIRDNALAVSGLLNPTIGGPSVYPYQPAGLWEEMAFGDGFSSQTYQQSHGSDLYRRSMYTFWKRTAAPAQMVTFDAPDREKCTAKRTITNTPLQALVLMNDPTYLEAARILAERVIKQSSKGPTKRAALAFRMVTSRDASKTELAELIRLAREQAAYFKKAPSEAEELLTNGESPCDKTIPSAELATWTMVASAILNLDETITKQ